MYKQFIITPAPPPPTPILSLPPPTTLHANIHGDLYVWELVYMQMVKYYIIVQNFIQNNK